MFLYHVADKRVLIALLIVLLAYVFIFFNFTPLLYHVTDRNVLVALLFVLCAYMLVS